MIHMMRRVTTYMACIGHRSWQAERARAGAGKMCSGSSPGLLLTPLSAFEEWPHKLQAIAKVDCVRAGAGKIYLGCAWRSP